jgi:hypothetical protein
MTSDIGDALYESSNSCELGLGGLGNKKSSGFSTYRPLFRIIFPIVSENLIGSMPKYRIVGKPDVNVSDL